MNRLALLFFCCLTALAYGAPFVTADPIPTTSGVTECGVTLDAAVKVFVPVSAVTPATVPPSIQCKVDTAPMLTGAHSIKLSHRAGAPWNVESADSAPLSFTKPAAPAVPAGLGLSP